jgi:nitrite reductase/ring-hydroxylating ferredoxin subunit
MSWEKVLSRNELPAGAKKVVKVQNKNVLMINHCDRIFAVDASCPHWGLPLEPGRLTDDCGLMCPWHRSAFDLATGDVKAWAPWPPGLGRVLGATSRQKVLPTFATRVDDDGSIWVSLEPSPKTETVSSEPKPS